jgi:muramoyltetrapeptide carboxypeptidase
MLFCQCLVVNLTRVWQFALSGVLVWREFLILREREGDEMSGVKQLPAACVPGDRVAIVAPSSPFSPSNLDVGGARLREWGLEPVYAPSLLDASGYLAGSDEARSGAFADAFRDDSIKAIVCARGGSGAARLLSLIPWEEIAASPKRFLGFSDITTLHLAIQQRCDFVSFHAPMVASGLFLEGSPESVSRVRLALCGKEWKDVFPTMRGRTLRGGKAKGQLIGGNLTVLTTSFGTPWQPDFRGKILFLEDVGEPPYRLDRMCQQMRLMGIWDEVAGVVLGDFGTLKDQYQTYEDEHFWRDRLALPEHCPIVYKAPFGHVRDNWTLPHGAEVELDGDAGTLRLV